MSNDALDNMPADMKPQGTKTNITNKIAEMGLKKPSKGKAVFWVLLILLVIVLAGQFMSAAKYQAQVQVIEGSRIGVNPTSLSLDFGDLPRDRSAVRQVNLENKGNMESLVLVWKIGEISDLLKVNKNNFVMPSHSEDKLTFTAYIPNSAEYRYYKGRVFIFQLPKFW